MIERTRYLEGLIARKHNGMVKVITGVRRCGKSVLLTKLFRKHLLESGVKAERIVDIALDKRKFAALQDPDRLSEYIAARIRGRLWRGTDTGMIICLGRRLMSSRPQSGR